MFAVNIPLLIKVSSLEFAAFRAKTLRGHFYFKECSLDSFFKNSAVSSVLIVCSRCTFVNLFIFMFLVYNTVICCAMCKFIIFIYLFLKTVVAIYCHFACECILVGLYSFEGFFFL